LLLLGTLVHLHVAWTMTKLLQWPTLALQGQSCDERLRHLSCLQLDQAV